MDGALTRNHTDDDDWHMISNATDVNTVANLPSTLSAELQRALDEQKHKHRSGESVVTDITCVFPAELVFNAARNFNADSATDDRSPFELKKQASYVVINSAAFGDYSTFKDELSSLCGKYIADRVERHHVLNVVLMLLDSRFSSRCLDDVKPVLGGFRVAFRNHAVTVQIGSSTVALTAEMRVTNDVCESTRLMHNIVMRLSLDYQLCHGAVDTIEGDGSDVVIAEAWSPQCTRDRGNFAVSLGLRPVADVG